MVVVSVIIPTFNRVNLLKRAVASVLAQTFDDFEVLVIDDNSTDGTREIMVQHSDPRVTYIRNTANKGANFSRNIGIRNSKGKFVAFLDDDDEWLPTKLEKQVKLLLSSSESVGAVYSGFRMITYDGREIIKWPKYKGHIFDKLLERNYVGTTSTVVVKKGVLAEVNGFDEVLQSSQDWDLWLRIAKRYEFDFVSEVLVNYNIIRQSITMNHAKAVNGRFQFFVKYAGFIPNTILRSNYYMKLGDALCFHGNMTLGRKYLLYAFLNDPTDVSCLTHLFSSFFGRSLFAKMYDLLSESRIAYALRRFSGTE